ncbi:TIR domain-containing protein [Actinomadura pelletieri DSM 43383]|uniref:TIR domain-containing protein n=1 Tax=Actinomadura pelletieri DSM 43383 TaxID=1120940 RepID=A0A495QYA6_9ACTN|nr:toll/interleukin-1 receptor domain-containing protein [Actinomadura pelletieri]RKS79047.1 TIR domain-containing protein [Actinomadura pelletieri DSM 43383]
MYEIFINYRSGDHFVAVEGLYSRLSRHFGDNAVFLDRGAIRSGERYPDVLRDKVEACEVLLAVIHPGWLTDTANGTRLIDREADWVRYEIATALRLGKVVIPVPLGDGLVPEPSGLPDSIRDLALRQAHVLHAGRFAKDVDALVGRLEHCVTPSWRPPEPVETVSSGSEARRWTILSCALGVGLVTAPPLVAAAYGRPMPEDEVPWPFTAAMWSALFMSAFPISVAGISLARRRVNDAEQVLHTVSSALYNSRFALPVGITLVVSLSLLVLAATGFGYPAFVTVIALLMAFAWFAIALLRNERREEDEEANWPQRPGRPVTSPALRRGVERTRRRLAGWPDPLTLEQRLKVGWALDVLAEGAAELARQSTRKRPIWLTGTYPRTATICVLWAAATVGLFLASLSPNIKADPAHSRYYIAVALFTTIVLALFGAGVELLYRHQRWVHGNVAAEVHGEIAELHRTLALRS